MYLKRFGYGDKDDKKITVLKLDRGTVLENQRAENFASANYFYDTNTSMTDKLKLMIFGYKDNDNGDSNKSRKEIKKPKLNWGN